MIICKIRPEDRLYLRQESIAAITQSNGLLEFVSPEVVSSGDHSVYCNDAQFFTVEEYRDKKVVLNVPTETAVLSILGVYKSNINVLYVCDESYYDIAVKSLTT